jgi:hypothetical protein
MMQVDGYGYLSPSLAYLSALEKKSEVIACSLLRPLIIEPFFSSYSDNS